MEELVEQLDGEPAVEEDLYFESEVEPLTAQEQAAKPLLMPEPEVITKGAGKSPFTLFTIASNVVLKELPRQILQEVAATLKMVVEKKKFEKRSKIPPLENPFRTGHFLDVVAYPEISESGNFFESSFYDITHAVTKFRGHASGQEKPGIMGGFRECWEYVASEGKTPLTLSILKDRPDMMSYNLAKLLFCREVERRMRIAQPCL